MNEGIIFPRRSERQPEAPPQKEFYRIPEAAAILGVSRSSVYKLIKEGDLQTVYVLSVQRVPRWAIDAFIERKRLEAQE